MIFPACARHLSFWVVLLALGDPARGVAGERDRWEKAHDRLRQESIALFQVILREREADLQRKPAPCEFRTEWNDYPVPASVARDHLGLRIPADLVPSESVGGPMEIMDPSATVPEAFCAKADDELRLSFIVESLKRGELKDVKDPNLRSRWFEIFRLEYTFPVFDRHYRRAIVIHTGMKRFWYRKPDGVFRGGLDFLTGASIYEKRKGEWRFLKHENIAHGHG
jgi:hypothetical protein